MDDVAIASLKRDLEGTREFLKQCDQAIALAEKTIRDETVRRQGLISAIGRFEGAIRVLSEH